MIKKIKNRILGNKIITTLIALSKKLVLPGFEGVPLYNVAVFFLKGIRNGTLTARASSVAFSFFLALFPTIIFLFTLIPYVPIENFQNQLMDLLRQFMPRSAFEATESTLEEIINQQHGSLLSFGFISALYFSSNGFHALIEAFNQSYHKRETRSALKERGITLILVVIQTVLIVIAISLIIFSEIILYRFIPKDHVAAYAIQVGRWIIILALLICTISFIYYLGPANKKRWKFISAGSTFATILFIITSLGFAFYVNNFGQYNKLYGSIGTLIVVLLWIYFNSIIMLLGFELNASIHSASNTKPPHE